MSDLPTESRPGEAEIARMAFELSQQLRDGEEAVVKLAAIEEIIDALMDKIPTLDPAVPWDALTAIRKVMR